MTAENLTNTLDGLREAQALRVFTAAGALNVRDGIAVFLAPADVPLWFDHESIHQILVA